MGDLVSCQAPTRESWNTWREQLGSFRNPLSIVAGVQRFRSVQIRDRIEILLGTSSIYDMLTVNFVMEMVDHFSDFKWLLDICSIPNY